MSNDHSFVLIKDLLLQHVINQEEFEKAELYFSLSSKSFNNHEEALAWLLTNRVVGSERQDEVKSKFALFNSGQSEPVYQNLSSDTSEFTNTSKSTFSAYMEEFASSPEPEEQHDLLIDAETSDDADLSDNYLSSTQAQDNLSIGVNSDSHQDSNNSQLIKDSMTNTTSILDNIYRYNVNQLNRLSQEIILSATIQNGCREKLKECPYLFCDLNDLRLWITSEFQSPISLTDNTELLNAEAALQLYSLHTKNIIHKDEYAQCYQSLLHKSPPLPFPSEIEMFQWLVKEQCFNHSLIDINKVKNYNHNISILEQLIHAPFFDMDSNMDIASVQAYIAKALEKSANLYFGSSMQLDDWIKEQKLLIEFNEGAKPIKKKKRGLKLWFILLLAGGVYFTYFSDKVSNGKQYSASKTSNVKNASESTGSSMVTTKNTDNKPESESEMLSESLSAVSSELQSKTAANEELASVSKTEAEQKSISTQTVADKVVSGSGVQNSQASTECAEKPYLNLLRNHRATAKVVSSLGSLQSISNVSQGDAQSCQASVTFDKGSADVTYTIIAKTKKNKSPRIDKVKYLNIVTLEQSSSTIQKPAEQDSSLIDEYETLMLKAIKALDAAMTERMPGWSKLSGAISLRIIGECEKKEKYIDTCPVQVSYLKAQGYSQSHQNYVMNVRFVMHNGKPALYSINEFLTSLMEEITIYNH